jgi:SAM-dependent methyltransferase
VHEQLARFTNAAIVEIGGGLSGMQFALASEGHSITNVDPGDEQFPFTDAQFEEVNDCFGARVVLERSPLQYANLADDSADAVISISTLEHLEPSELGTLLAETRRILKPNGILVISVDLFLNLAPFSRRSSNRYGVNVPIWRLLQEQDFELLTGCPGELFSGPGFEPHDILGRLSQLMIGETYPALSQLLVAAKPPLVGLTHACESRENSVEDMSR